jgi:ubiquitin-protein ligase
MTDKVFSNFLERQLTDGRSLAANSDILRLVPAVGTPPQQYIAEFRCKGAVQERDGHVGEGGLFVLGIFFPSDYLRRAATQEVLTWLAPANVLHPNIFGPAGAICIGRLEPGTGLVDILYQVFEIIVYRKFNPREYDSLNKSACAWARNNQGRFPTDPRPLRRPSYMRQEALIEQERGT